MTEQFIHTSFGYGDFTAFGSSILTGDFDSDGIVTGFDFLVWQSVDGTPAGLAAWETNYGTSVLTGAVAAASAVPEPSSAALAAIATTLWMRRRKKQ